MKRMTKLITVCILLTGILVISWAAGKRLLYREQPVETLPAAAEEYAKLTNTYRNQSAAVNMEGEINLYEGSKPEVVKERMPFIYRKNGESFLSSIGGMMVVSDGTLLVQLDTVNSVISVARITDSLQNLLSGSIVPFEKLMEDSAAFKTVVEVQKNGELRQLVIKSESIPEIEECRVTYHPNNYLISACDITWRKWTGTGAGDNAFRWITHTSYRYPAPEPWNASAVVSGIVQLSGDTLYPAAAYRNYRVHIGF